MSDQLSDILIFLYGREESSELLSRLQRLLASYRTRLAGKTPGQWSEKDAVVIAYGDMLRGDLYSPYTWAIRRFAEGETNETLIRFTPNGTAYGFRERLSEDEPGANLEPEAARVIAEKAVGAGWPDVVLAEYELVESSHEVRPGGRTDHTLVYERPDIRIGDGHYRLLDPRPRRWALPRRKPEPRGRHSEPPVRIAERERMQRVAPLAAAYDARKPP